MFFKFNKYSIIETIWTLISLACDLIIAIHWGFSLFNVKHYIIFLVFIIFTIFGFYRAFVSWTTYNIRVKDYYHATYLFKKYGVKKSILYELQSEPCSQPVAYQLMKDFDVENMKKIND